MIAFPDEARGRLDFNLPCFDHDKPAIVGKFILKKKRKVYEMTSVKVFVI